MKRETPTIDMIVDLTGGGRKPILLSALALAQAQAATTLLAFVQDPGSNRISLEKDLSAYDLLDDALDMLNDVER